MNQDEQIARQKIQETNKLIEVFDDLDFKFKIEREIEMHGYLIQVAVVSATVLGLVAALGRDAATNPLGILGIVFLAVSVIGGLFYPLYSTESGVINANKAHGSVQKKNFQVLEVWTKVITEGKTAVDAANEHLEIARKGVDNPWAITINRNPYRWIIFSCFASGIVLLVLGVIGPSLCRHSHEKYYSHHLNQLSSMCAPRVPRQIR